jgi:hypothetical protein
METICAEMGRGSPCRSGGSVLLVINDALYLSRHFRMGAFLLTRHDGPRLLPMPKRLASAPGSSGIGAPCSSSTRICPASLPWPLKGG